MSDRAKAARRRPPACFAVESRSVRERFPRWPRTILSEPFMAPRKPKVVVTRKLPDAVETRMRELFDTELNLDDAPMDAEALAAAMNRADVLAPTITDRLDAAVLARAGDRVKLIAN